MPYKQLPQGHQHQSPGEGVRDKCDYLTRKAYEKLSLERGQTCKSTVLHLLERMGMPSGYVASDDRRQMSGNSFLRLKPAVNKDGAVDFQFFHSINYRNGSGDQLELVLPTEEVFWISSGRFIATRNCWDKNDSFGDEGQVKMNITEVPDLQLPERLRDVVRSLNDVPHVVATGSSKQCR